LDFCNDAAFVTADTGHFCCETRYDRVGKERLGEVRLGLVS
jgi:hypothetical protein